MENKKLNEIALQEAKKILKAYDEQEFNFQLKGSAKEWDDAVYKTTFEIVYNVFKTAYIVDLELDANSGEILSCKEINVPHS